MIKNKVWLPSLDGQKLKDDVKCEHTKKTRYSRYILFGTDFTEVCHFKNWFFVTQKSVALNPLSVRRKKFVF